MDADASVTMEVAALSRPFSLGMLYDCRRDLLIPGMTLWGHEDLMKNIAERPQRYSEFEIVASESIEDKASALNVSAGLKASFCSGMISVEGSAKYLNDDKKSNNQARVSLKYGATTKFQQLSMDHLGKRNVKYTDVFEQKKATHVVTGILYGANAFFVFNSDVSREESRQDAEGKLKVMINKIPSIEINGDGSLNMKETELKKVEAFSCTFHGDFLLEKNPASFKDAVQVYQSLSTLLGADGEYAVPQKVWLLPLVQLEASAATLTRELSPVFMEEVQVVLEELKEVQMRCNDALSTTTKQFSQIGKKIKTFKDMCSGFTLEFQRTLGKMVPMVRDGTQEEHSVIEEILRRRSSPFNSKNLNQWMDCKEREIYTLDSFTSRMENTTIVPSQAALYKEVLRAKHALCFVYTSLDSAEPYLTVLSNYLKETRSQGDPRDAGDHDVQGQQWYSTKEVTDAMRKKAKLFSDFAEANKENKNVTFLVVGFTADTQEGSVGSTSDTQEGSSIYLYQDGNPVKSDFEPPSKPETLTVNHSSHNSVTLKISPPKFGAENITSYSVEFCVRGEHGWQQQTASSAGEVTLSELSPDTEYVFRCRAVTSVGVGPANDVRGPVKTSPFSPQVGPDSIFVRWEKPELGEDVQIVSYMVEYAETNNGAKEEDFQWKQVLSSDEGATVSGLRSDVEYVVRVTCDCGEVGRCKTSISKGVMATSEVLLTGWQKFTPEPEETFTDPVVAPQTDQDLLEDQGETSQQVPIRTGSPGEKIVPGNGL